MIVNDILDEAKETFGLCEGPKLFKRLTMSIELLSNESQWDASLAYVTLNVDKTGVVALPRDIETPLGVNIDGIPAFNRDRWFLFHINGPGSFTRIDSFRHFWDNQGDFPIIQDISAATLLSLTAVNATDNGKIITLYGRDENGNELRTGSTRGLQLAAGATTTVKVLCIDAIAKPVTIDSLDLRESPGGILLGTYFSDQTSPMIRRARTPANTTLTIQYRRANLNIVSVNDFIALNNQLALVAAMKSVKAIFNSNKDDTEAWRNAAIKLANAEQESRNAVSAIGPQVMNMGSRSKKNLWGNLRSSRRHGCCPNIF